MFFRKKQRKSLFKRNPYPGVFIVLEGIDGCGKSTQTKRLVEALEERGMDVLRTYEPWYGGKLTDDDVRLRQAIRQERPLPPEEIQELMVQNRGRHLMEQVIRELKFKHIVVSERYCFSTFAYGQATTSLTFKDIAKLHEALPDFFLPDLTFIFDVDPKTALERKSTSAADVFEKLETLARARAVYRELPKRFAGHNVRLVDASGSVEEIGERIRPFVDHTIVEKLGSVGR